MKSTMFLEDRGSVDLLVHIEDMNYIAKCHGRIHQLEVALARMLSIDSPSAWLTATEVQAIKDQAREALGKPAEDFL